MLLVQLKEKFGFINPVIERRIGEIRSTEKLDSLLKAIIHAQSIEDLDI